MTNCEFNDRQAARALVEILGSASWEAVAIARGYLALADAKPDEEAARAIYENGPLSLKRCRELVLALKKDGFLAALTPRERTGSAANPVTKLFPAIVTERRFVELLDQLCALRPTLRYTDDREVRHSLTDFTLVEGDQSLPVNIKNAGTRFESAKSLVNLDPDDCIPIPAYKAQPPSRGFQAFFTSSPWTIRWRPISRRCCPRFSTGTSRRPGLCSTNTRAAG